MRLFSKSERILGSKCIPELGGHPQVKPPVLWQRAPSRAEIRSHINHPCDTNSSHKYVIIATPSQHFAWHAWTGVGGSGLSWPAPVYNNAPGHSAGQIDVSENEISLPLYSFYLVRLVEPHVTRGTVGQEGDWPSC